MAQRETRTDFYRLNVGVAGFLAGIMFAAMSMLIKFYEDMEHGELLIVFAAVDCLLFTLFAFGSVRLGSVKSADAGPFAKFIKFLGTSAMVLFLATVPLLVLQVTFAGFVVVTAAVVILAAIYHIMVWRARDADAGNAG